ncbi:hypothetical protein BN946_scf184653.g1 [Trametes cinnabarina]|uniref:Uncharacterized protein n=1 Tax=Pycnoporus cinnabarinus TaxID=5643 RepID=A0A060SIG3_PYCCI|nr:hypothetical protein BN946_scf184653.g1 [Trametes cinnabarina]
MPPLMLLSAQVQAVVPGQQLVVVYGSGCLMCVKFICHIAAATNEPAFHATATQVQAELQVQFWWHFQAHMGSGGGEKREHELREREQELRECDGMIERLQRLRQQIYQLKESIWDCKKNQACLAAELGALDCNPQTLSEPVHLKHFCQCDLHEESPWKHKPGQRQSTVPAEMRQLVSYLLWHLGPPPSEAGPSGSSFQEVQSSDVMRLASQPVEDDSDDELVPMLPPAQFGPSSNMAWDEEAKTEYEVINEDRIKRPPPGESEMSRWPYHHLLPPTDSDPHQANHWYKYVPMTWSETVAPSTTTGQSRSAASMMTAAPATALAVPAANHGQPSYAKSVKAWQNWFTMH